MSSKTTLRRAATGIIAVLALWNSVYFRKLDEVKAGKAVFNAAGYAKEFWTTKLPPALGDAVDTDRLLALLQTDREKTFADYSHALGIGNIRYFLVKGSGTVQTVEENHVVLKTASGKVPVRIATEYIFGNAVRDASGLIDINAFVNSMDFNNVSAEINRMIREKVIPPFRAKVKAGDVVDFSGAVELNREYPDPKEIEVVPITLAIRNP